VLLLLLLLLLLIQNTMHQTTMFPKLLLEVTSSFHFYIKYILQHVWKLSRLVFYAQYNHPAVIIAVRAPTSKDECHGVSDYNVEKCSTSIQFLYTSHRKQKAILYGLLVLQEPMNTILILNGLNIATLHCKITSKGF